MRYLLLVAAKYRNLTLVALAVHLGDDGKTFFARAAGFGLRHREEEALQKVDAERQHGAYLVRGLKALGHDLHAALVRVGYGVRHDLALIGVGVDVFDFDKADFSPLVDFDRFDKAVAVTQVQHAARVKVDEKGCEAAAFTAVRADAQSAAPEDLPVVEMDLNRPFAFMITGVDGLPLFLGTVNNL